MNGFKYVFSLICKFLVLITSLLSIDHPAKLKESIHGWRSCIPPCVTLFLASVASWSAHLFISQYLSLFHRSPWENWFLNPTSSIPTSASACRYDFFPMVCCKPSAIWMLAELSVMITTCIGLSSVQNIFLGWFIQYYTANCAKISWHVLEAQLSSCSSAAWPCINQLSIEPSEIL